MCGFTFILKKKILKKEFDSKNFLKYLKKRGNDSDGNFFNEEISVFFQRLSIIDHQFGSQPMLDNERNYLICFSGELYNYLELKNELSLLGVKFFTNSDTEVMLEGYKKYGSKFLNKVNGMFSMIIWNFKEKKAFVARDRLGKKPLYWYQDENIICLSTNIETFKNFDLINSNNLNINSLINFIIHNGENNSSNFFFNKLKKFPRANYCYLEKNRNFDFKLKKYWEINFEKKNNNLNYFIEKFEYLLQDSIKIRLRSDTNKALALSGGIDSSTIAYIVKEKLKKEINYINIDNEKYRKDTLNDDNPSDIEKFLKIKINYIKLNKEEYLKSFETDFQDNELPHNQPQSILLDKMTKNIGSHSKILLTGNGADENFFGYNGDERFKLLNYLTMATKSINYLNKEIIFKYLKIKNSKVGRQLHSNYSSDIFFDQVDKNDELKNIDILDLKFYLSIFYRSEYSNYILPDEIGLKNNVEIRSPFLDYRLIEFSSSLPHKFKLPSISENINNKFILKKLAEKYFPKKIIYKEKRGFGWNLNFNKLFIENYNYKKSISNLSSFGFNIKFLEKNFIFFKNQTKKKMHPNIMSSRIFFNSLFLSQWLKKLTK